MNSEPDQTPLQRRTRLNLSATALSHLPKDVADHAQKCFACNMRIHAALASSVHENARRADEIIGQLATSDDDAMQLLVDRAKVDGYDFDSEEYEVLREAAAKLREIAERAAPFRAEHPKRGEDDGEDTPHEEQGEGAAERTAENIASGGKN